MIEKQDIKRYLPHREPFLFVDGVTEIIKDEYIKGFKEVKEDEYYFKGHFPDNPILPGVIIIEALAQVSGILGFVTMNKTPEEGSIYYFVGADNVRFRSPVVPPNILTLESKKIQDEVFDVIEQAANKALENGEPDSSTLMTDIYVEDNHAG